MKKISLKSEYILVNIAIAGVWVSFGTLLLTVVFPSLLSSGSLRPYSTVIIILAISLLIIRLEMTRNEHRKSRARVQDRSKQLKSVIHSYGILGATSKPTERIEPELLESNDSDAVSPKSVIRNLIYLEGMKYYEIQFRARIRG